MGINLKGKLFKDVYPEGAAMLNPVLNPDVDIDTLSAGSVKECVFQCLSNPKHIFKKKVCKMVSYRDGRGVGCKFCGPNRSEAFPGETDFFTVVPEAREMWDSDAEENKKLDPSKLFPTSNKYAIFKCKNGHRERRKISDFTKAPCCQSCKNYYVNQDPMLRTFWDEERNRRDGIDLETLIIRHRDIIHLSCPNCDYKWAWQSENWKERHCCPHCGYDGTEGSCNRNRALTEELYHITTISDCNSLATSTWNYEMNNGVIPQEVSAKSSKSYYFNCSSNGHLYQEHIYKMYDANGEPAEKCPICREEKREAVLVKMRPISVGFAKRRTVSENPDLMKFWDEKANTLDPERTSVYSNEIAVWRCKTCNYSWAQSISLRADAEKAVCPCHDLKRATSDEVFPGYFESFMDAKPEAAKYFNRELNGDITPESVSKSSGKMVWMNCAAGTHPPYQIRIIRITENAPYGCPECKKEDSLQLSLKHAVPIAEKMWAPENEIPLDDVRTHDSISKKFICTEGHRFLRTPRSFVNDQSCPICSLDSVAKHPEMMRFWSAEKNPGLDPWTISPNSKTQVTWVCSDCGFSWTTEVASRNMSHGTCPCCEERVVFHPGYNDLLTVVPDAALDIRAEDNPEIDIHAIPLYGQYGINWHCHVCGFSWSTINAVARLNINDDGTYGLRSCPVCAGIRRTIKFYIDTYPEIFEDYNKELNGKDYTDISDGEIRDEFWWNCTNEDCRATYKVTIQRRIASRDAFTKGCPYCAGKKVFREKSFGALHEDLLDEYGAENELDPYEVTEHSSKPVIWHCRNNPEHKWTATFHERACGFKSCRICYPYAKYDVMLCDVHPEFGRYYSDSNKRDFNTYSLYSNEIAEWKCDMGHTFSREVYKVGAYDDTFRCPVCDGTIVLSEVNSVSTMRPELIALWSAENEMSPDETFYNKQSPVLWDCQKCHGMYPMKISDKKPDNTDCPYCNNEKLLPAFNDLRTAYLELAAEWSENNPDSPSDYLRTSAHTALWACPTCYGEYAARICDRTVGDDACPYCRHKKVLAGFNDLASVYLELAAEWSENNPDSPSDYLRTSAHTALWACPTCYGEYAARICDRTVGDDACPYCRHKKVLAGFNDLASVYLELAAEWSENNPDSPSDYLRTSARTALWSCPTCHGEYEARICDRTVDDDSCPYCRQKKVLAGFNDLASVDSELASEWSLANPDKPSEYLRTSPHKALWACPTCHGEYEACVCDRFVNDCICPYCNEKKVLPGFNSFAVKHPDEMEEWDELANYLLADPNEILSSYNQKLWWNCPQGHKYDMSPKQKLYYRMRKMQPCPYCKGRRRKLHHFF